MGKKFMTFWLSQTISQLGSEMTSFALIIWSYQQTNSAMSVSLMAFCFYLPFILVSIFAGNFIDKNSKKKIMLLSDLIATICSVLILILNFNGSLYIYHIYAYNMINGLMNAFQSPAETVAIGMMVPSDKYAKASGYSSFSENLLTIVTPILSTTLFSFMGLDYIIFFDLVTFIFAFFVLLYFIKLPENIKSEKTGILDGCKEGLSFLNKNRGLLYIILGMALLNFFSRLTYQNILSPMLLARTNKNNEVLGIVTSILGIGGVLGGMLVAAKKNGFKNNLKSIFFSAAFSFLFGDLLMGLGQNVYLWSIAALAASIPIPFVFAGQRTIMYNTIPKDLQGRVFAVRNAIQYCTIPVGILLGGFLADFVFEPFMQNSKSVLAESLRNLVGTGSGSGMAVMFLCTGVLGFISSILLYINRNVKKLNDKDSSSIIKQEVQVR
jgi:MFS family permease